MTNIPVNAARAVAQSLHGTLGVPFDLLRFQHAEAVHAGWLANSMLESRDFERRVDALEHAVLGLWARKV